MLSEVSPDDTIGSLPIPVQPDIHSRVRAAVADSQETVARSNQVLATSRVVVQGIVDTLAQMLAAEDRRRERSRKA